jgi:hypothetical protein
MWRGRLRRQYSDFEEFQAYSETYGLAERLGYDTPEEAWKDNPMVQGSTNPRDFDKWRSPKERKELRKAKEEFTRMSCVDQMEWLEGLVGEDRIRRFVGRQDEDAPCGDLMEEIYENVPHSITDDAMLKWHREFREA